MNTLFVIIYIMIFMIGNNIPHVKHARNELENKLLSHESIWDKMFVTWVLTIQTFVVPLFVSVYAYMIIKVLEKTL